MNNKIFRLPAVLAQTGLSRSTIYAKVQIGEFPPPIRLGPRSVGWLQSDIDGWIQERIDGREHTKKPVGEA